MYLSLKKQNIIAIDGPSGVGKGTLALRLAQHFNAGYLDSGVLYRSLALSFSRHLITDFKSAKALKQAESLKDDIELVSNPQLTVWLRGEDITNLIRSDTISQFASQLAQSPAIRSVFLDLQTSFAQKMIKEYGLMVSDGRDMTSVVFKQAKWKFYLTAHPEVRTLRRFVQNHPNSPLSFLLKEPLDTACFNFLHFIHLNLFLDDLSGIMPPLFKRAQSLIAFKASQTASQTSKRFDKGEWLSSLKGYIQLAVQMQQRDQRDSQRKVARLSLVDEAWVVDSSYLDLDGVFKHCLALVESYR